MNVGVVCYASVGGSGIIATELGKALAARGHRIHILSSDTPARLGDYQPGLWFHRVETPSYPLFREPQYVLSLANKIVQVSRSERLDIVHAHYAIPHAAAAYLARQVLASMNPTAVPRVITTLHGTDITLLGSDRSYSEIVAFGID
jgi:N-acetyl-alpha-D-glucosaminyl L-malate synthase BshA